MGKFNDYYQCGSCKSEHTFAKRGLFVIPNYDVIPDFLEEHSAVFRRRTYRNDNYVEYRPAKECWGGPLFDLQAASSIQALNGNAAILEAIRKNLPIVTHTEIWDTNTHHQAIIECPIKTMNYR